MSFLLAGCSSIFNGLCFAELATRLPVSGSSYLYVPLAAPGDSVEIVLVDIKKKEVLLGDPGKDGKIFSKCRLTFVPRYIYHTLR